MALSTEAGKLEADFCVIGGGPAGLVVASALSAKGRNVLLIESGPPSLDTSVQELNDGDMSGDAYAGLGVTRHRQVGGTAAIWNTPVLGGMGAKYLPLDATDFEPRWPDASHGWPLEFEELLPYYQRAQQACGLGPFVYDRSLSSSSSPVDAGPLQSKLYQFGTTAALIDPLLTALETSARVVSGLTATGIVVEGNGVQVNAARWRTNETVRINARRVVLACGAIENARLLLLARIAGGEALDKSGWPGCGFMEHPRDRTMQLLPSGPNLYRHLAWYDQHAAHDGTTIAGRFAIDSALLKQHDLLNASVTLLPNVRPERMRYRELLRRARVRTPSRWFPSGGHGWSRHPAPSSVYNGFTLLLNLEQPPRRENRITLGSRVDRHGNPLPLLHWRWHDDDQARLEKLRTVVAHSIQGAGLGRVVVQHGLRPDPNAHHHAGTTRMHNDPTLGVVDANGRVHGTTSLYAAGASVFPTSGFANPTLTIVAMALRLADHLAVDTGR